MTQRPPKQASKADKKADKESARAHAHRGTLTVEVAIDPKVAAEHASLTSLYFEAYEAARGSKPPFDDKDGKAIKQLRAKCGLETAAKAIRGAFADSFWCNRVTIRMIADDPAKYVGLKASGSGGRGPRQPNGGDWKPVVEDG